MLNRSGEYNSCKNCTNREACLNGKQSFISVISDDPYLENALSDEYDIDDPFCGNYKQKATTRKPRSNKNKIAKNGGKVQWQNRVRSGKR